MKLEDSKYGLFIKFFTYFLYLNIILFCIIEHLVIGGGWNTGIPLGIIDNLQNGGDNLYPSLYLEKGQDIMNVHSGLFYFPGNIFIAFICRTLFHYNAETAIVILSGFIALFLLTGFNKIISAACNYKYLLSVVTGLFFIFEFRWAKYYLFEIHPDLIVLCFFLWAVIFIDKTLKKDKFSILDFIIISALLFLSGIFKQTSVFLFLGLGMYAIFSKTLNLKSKLFIIFSECFAGLLVLSTVFSIKNCWYNTVISNVKFPLMVIDDYLNYLMITFKDCYLYILLLIIFLILFIFKKIKLSTELEKLWFLPSIIWMLFNLFGTSFREGADCGNMESAMISCLPFVVILIFQLFKIFTNKINVFSNTKIMIISKKVLLLAIIIFFICGEIVYISVMKENYIKFKKRKYEENIVADYLKKNYSGKKIPINSAMYEMYNNSGIIKSVDLFTFNVYSLGNVITERDLMNIKEKENWDVILTINGCCNAEFFPEVFKDYKLKDTYKTIGTTIPILIYERTKDK